MQFVEICFEFINGPLGGTIDFSGRAAISTRRIAEFCRLGYECAVCHKGSRKEFAEKNNIPLLNPLQGFQINFHNNRRSGQLLSWRRKEKQSCPAN